MFRRRYRPSIHILCYTDCPSVLDVSLFLRLRAFCAVRAKRGGVFEKNERLAYRCITPSDSHYAHRLPFLFVVIVFKKTRLSSKNGRNPPFFDCKKGVNFILFLLTRVSFFRTMKVSRGERNLTAESAETKMEDKMKKSFSFYTKKAVCDAIEYRRLCLLAFGHSNLSKNKLFNGGRIIYAAEQSLTRSLTEAYTCKKRYSVSEKKRLFKILKAGFTNWRTSGDWRKAFKAWNKL